MTVKLKGFMVIQELLSNVPNTVSVLGELSTWSMTYTKERGEYINSDYPDYRLVAIRSVDTETGLAALNETLANQAIDVVRYTHLYAKTNGRSYDTAVFIANVLAEFNGEVGTIKIGSLIDNGSIALPGWISWVSATNNNATVKIWLADMSFRSQFDEYEITVIPPIEDLNKFFTSYATIQAELNAVTYPLLMERVQNAKSGNPETYIRTSTFDFTHRSIGAEAISTVWNVLIYGVQGDSVDAIKDAIVAYVLANSDHTQAEWEVVIPELFKRTEFIILPRWDLQSIPDKAVQAGLYSPQSNPTEVVTFAKTQIDFYEDAHIESNITIIPFPYKELTLIVINGSNNTPTKAVFGTVFPDYIPEPTSSTDFNRMTVYTREWVLAIEHAIIAAEDADEYSDILNTLRKVWRDDKLYISLMYDNVNYLVSAYQNYGN